MKTLFMLLNSLLFTVLLHAQEKSLVGTWNITECAVVTAEGTEKIMQEEIKSGEAFSEYVFMDDGSYKLKTNMSGSGVEESYEGTWKDSDNKLVMTLVMNGQTREIEWAFEFKDDLLVLTRSSPDGTVTVHNSFRKD